jgi:O-antigen/teichoic acid export membrane protein
MRYAGALLIIDAAFALSSQLAPLMIGGFLGVAAVGIYQAPARLIVFLQYPGLAVANSVAPGLARGENHEPDVRTFSASLRYLIVFQGLLLAPVIVWARPIVDLLLGPGYGESAQVLRALAPYIFFAGLAPLVSLGVNFLGEARLRVPVSLIDVGLDIGLTAALLPTIGIVGAAIASDVTAFLYVPLHLWICRRMIDLPIRPLVVSLARTLAAAAVMAAVLFAFGTDHLSVIEWIAGGACGLAAFAAVIFATGELRPGEVRELARRIRGRLRRN